MTEPSELTQLRNVVARARELIEEGHHSTSGPCETCKAFIVLINSVPASLAEPKKYVLSIDAAGSLAVAQVWQKNDDGSQTLLALVEGAEGVKTFAAPAPLAEGGEQKALEWTYGERAGRMHEDAGPWRIRRAWSGYGKYGGDWEVSHSMVQKPSGAWTQHAVIAKGIETEIEARSLAARLQNVLPGAPSRAPEQKCQHLRVIEQARQAKEGETPNNTGGWMWPPVCQDCGEELPFGTPETMPHDFVAPSRAEGLARECNSCGRNHPSSVCPEWNAPKAVPSRAPEEVLDSTHDEGCECRTSRKETAVCICDFSAPSRAPEPKTENLVAEGTEEK
jgi:hypothetical protein